MASRSLLRRSGRVWTWVGQASTKLLWEQEDKTDAPLRIWRDKPVQMTSSQPAWLCGDQIGGSFV
ncbi:MAG TPA: hypothetical protein VFA18_19890, partial [Gemmataceae bacterium]|nr:hypothetical protein [Gemmataceae bacterium]